MAARIPTAELLFGEQDATPFVQMRRRQPPRLTRVRLLRRHADARFWLRPRRPDSDALAVRVNHVRRDRRQPAETP